MSYPLIMIVEEQWHLQSRLRREPYRRTEIARRLAEIETRIASAERNART